MGNEGSKQSLPRSDTGSSVKSSRSFRSGKASKASKLHIHSQSSSKTSSSGSTGSTSTVDNNLVQNNSLSNNKNNNIASNIPEQFDNDPLSEPTTGNSNVSSTPSVKSRRSSFKSLRSFRSNKSSERNESTTLTNTTSVTNDTTPVNKTDYDYIYDEESSINQVHEQNTSRQIPQISTNSKVPPSMAILKPKSPILRMNSSSSINDNSIQHMSNVERSHSNTTSDYNNISRRNSSNTINSSNSRNSKRSSSHSRNSRSSSYSETHGIPIDSFNEMHLNSPTIPPMSSPHDSTSTPVSPASKSFSRSSSFANKIKLPFSKEEKRQMMDDNNSNAIMTDDEYTSQGPDDLDKPNDQEIDGIQQNQQLDGIENASNIENQQINSDENTLAPNTYDYRRKYDLNIEDLIQRLLDTGYSGKRTKSVCLKNSEIALICSVAREIFLSQPTLLELSAPVKIVGDIHGQYIDLIRIFSKCGFPPASNYLFLGDYVDRGKQSLETILLLLCYKIKFPENFFLLRGNHECAQITRQYGFYDECKRRTNLKTWKLFVDTFNTLPIAAIVASKIFCVHGGLSPVLNSMDEIRNIRRPTDVPDFGLLNDLLWSDPTDSPNQWEDNERGVSYCFNKVAINNFLNKFQFDLVVRAHMVVEDGYEFFNERSLVTVFSAPNYCGEFDNWGAVMGVSEELLCSFELLDPLDSVALKNLMKKGRIERRNAMLNFNSNKNVNENSKVEEVNNN